MTTAARPRRPARYLTWLEKRDAIRREWRTAMRVNALAWKDNMRADRPALAEFSLESAIKSRRMAEMYANPGEP